MRKLAQIAIAVLFAGSAIALAASPTNAAPKRARTHHPHVGMTSSFDGMWSVSVFTRAGQCDASYRYPAQIIGGRVTGGGDGSYSVSGYVSPNGRIAVTVSQSNGSATGYGRLSGSHGGGLWRTSGGECSGVWSASRRG
jgi:hypothetical protein